MPTMTFAFRVELEDGTTYSVVADQRDAVRWEKLPGGGSIGDETKRMQMVRFLAWSASSRQQLTDLKWPQFDAQLVEAVDDEEAGESADAEDPGRTAR